jgi:hypothetical protein
MHVNCKDIKQFINVIKFFSTFNIILQLTIPIKMVDFLDAEISIYSRAEYFIYLFEDFIQRFSNETPCP